MHLLKVHTGHPITIQVEHVKAAQTKRLHKEEVAGGKDEPGGLGKSGPPPLPKPRLSLPTVYQSGFCGWGLGGIRAAGGPMVMLLLVTLGPYQPAQ